MSYEDIKKKTEKPQFHFADIKKDLLTKGIIELLFFFKIILDILFRLVENNLEVPKISLIIREKYSFFKNKEILFLLS